MDSIRPGRDAIESITPSRKSLWLDALTKDVHFELEGKPIFLAGFSMPHPRLMYQNNRIASCPDGDKVVAIFVNGPKRKPGKKNLKVLGGCFCAVLNSLAYDSRRRAVRMVELLEPAGTTGGVVKFERTGKSAVYPVLITN